MGLEISDKAKEIIKSRHLGNARSYEAEISNILHNAFVNKDKTVDAKQLQADGKALKKFREDTYARK